MLGRQKPRAVALEDRVAPCLVACPGIVLDFLRIELVEEVADREVEGKVLCLPGESC
jgi:hypothetical protein